MSVRGQEMQWGRLLEAAQTLMDFAVAMGAARPVCNLSVGELLDEFETAKRKAGRSDRYLRQMRTSTRAVLGSRMGRPLAELATKEIDSALGGLPVAPRTVRTYFTDVRTLLNFAVRRQYLTSNPAAVIDPPTVAAEPPKIHGPQEAKAILDTALKVHPRFCRRLAVRYFAGLRSAEAFRLAEDEIKVAQGVVEVLAAKAKTRRRRLVEIQPNLKAWLAVTEPGPVGRTSGLASRIAREAGVEWHRNVTRHSFCSYHLAHFQSAARTALEAGHSEAVLFGHYRELVTREAAAAFFSVVP